MTSPDVADEIAQAETVSLAMLVILETLSPLERAVFVLREAFAFSYAEIGDILDRSDEAIRQLARRARQHVQERQRRFDTDRATQQKVTEQFLAATINGDLVALLSLLSPDVTLHADGGGIAKAPRRTIKTADKVGRFLTGISAGSLPEPRAYLATINSGLAVVITSEGSPAAVIALDLIDGKIANVNMLANPEKLVGLADVEQVGTPIPLDRAD